MNHLFEHDGMTYQGDLIDLLELLNEITSKTNEVILVSDKIKVTYPRSMK